MVMVMRYSVHAVYRTLTALIFPARVRLIFMYGQKQFLLFSALYRVAFGLSCAEGLTGSPMSASAMGLTFLAAILVPGALDLTAAMGQAGREMAAEWSWDVIARRWETCILDVLGTRQ